jgi:hypothetical protein
VSELCHIHPQTPGTHRDLGGHVAAHRCCGKSLIGSVLVGFRVRQHARRESISKRAPSTTRPSLRMFRINELRAAWNSVAQNLLQFVCSEISRPKLRLAGEEERPSCDLCQTSRCCSDYFSPRSSRRNHAFASFQSRFTVSLDTARTSAVSSTVNPPKNRNSTT